MGLVTLKELKEQLPKGKRLMGIDHSEKALGLALSSPDFTFAMPLQTIKRVKFSKDVVQLSLLCKDYAIGGFIIGLPINMDGTEGPRTMSVRHFADNLIRAKKELGFDPLIAFFDERLSTYAADQFMDDDPGMTRKKRGEVIDKLAAQIILDNALRQMNSSSTP